MLAQLAEYEAEHGRNFDASNAFPPESQPLGFVFSRSKILRQIERDRRLSAQRPAPDRSASRCRQPSRARLRCALNLLESRARALELRPEFEILNHPRAPRERTGRRRYARQDRLFQRLPVYDVNEAVTKTEALLNLLWVTVCAGALGLHFWRNYFREGAQTQAVRLRRTLSVLLAAVALFPCISASDDRVRLGDLDSAPVSQTAYNRPHLGAVLLPILEDPEHGQTVAPFVFAAMASSFATVSVESPVLVKGVSFATLGRAPPVSFA